MPRKSNKTAHVLSLLTNPEVKDEEKSETSNSSDKSSNLKENQNLSVFSNYQNEPLSDLIKDELTKFAKSEGSLDNINEIENNNTFLNEDKNNTDYTRTSDNDIKDVLLNDTQVIEDVTFENEKVAPTNDVAEETKNLSVAELGKEKESFENIESHENKLLENEKVHEEVVKKNIDQKNSFNENIIEEKLINHSNDTLPVTEKSENNFVPSEEVFDGKTKNFCLNIMENLVLDCMKEIIPKTGVCNCERCVKDILAISLNNLPPKYIVTDKGRLMSLVDVYRYQYSISIMTEITKACFQVKNSPNH